LPMPNMIIYLHASLDTLLDRIHMRGRDVEQNIQADYLQQLIRDYDTYKQEFEHDQPNIAVIRINGDTCDLYRHQQDLNKIIQKVQYRLNDMKRTEGNKQ